MNDGRHGLLKRVSGLLLLLLSTVIVAGPADNIVTISAKNSKITEIYGAYLKCGLVLTDPGIAKIGETVTVTFHKGKKNELTVPGSWIGSYVAGYIKIDKTKAGIPEGFSYSQKAPFKVDQSVKLWSYRKGFSALDATISEVRSIRPGNTSFMLPGYIEGASGCVVTTAKGELAGITVLLNKTNLVADTNSIREHLRGQVTGGDLKVEKADKNGARIKARITTSDPLKKLSSVGAVYWTGPHYISRRLDKNGYIVPRMKGDGKPGVVPMKRTDAGEFECSFTVKIPHEQTLFVGLAEISDRKKVGRIISAPKPNNDFRYITDAALETKGLVPYTKGTKPPSPLKKPPAKPPRFPAVDMTKVDPKSFFPFQEGNEWTYQRSQMPLALRATNLSGGYTADLYDEKGLRYNTQRACRMGSTHTEVYRIHKVLADRCWLKIYSHKKDLLGGLVRDSRYENVESAMLQWRLNSSEFICLDEINKVRSNGKVSHLVQNLISINRIHLKEQGKSGVNNRSNPISYREWDVEKLKIDTPAGSFGNCLVAKQLAQLTNQLTYTRLSYYYPGVGLIKEKLLLNVPVQVGPGQWKRQGVPAYEMVLLSFKVGKKEKKK